MIQELTREIERTVRAIVDEIHTAMPGKIVSINTKNGTASVLPSGKYVTSDKKALDYPVLTEVPLIFPFCQKNEVGIVFPVEKGDSCLIIISEVELDKWRSEAESEGSLRFDLTSAIAIPGLLNGGGNLISKAVDKNAVLIMASETELSVSKKGVEATVKGTTFSVSEGVIAIGGDLKVEGNISYTGSLING